jgi:hypothetical protein
MKLQASCFCKTQKRDIFLHIICAALGMLTNMYCHRKECEVMPLLYMTAVTKRQLHIGRIMK